MVTCRDLVKVGFFIAGIGIGFLAGSLFVSSIFHLCISNDVYLGGLAVIMFGVVLMVSAAADAMVEESRNNNESRLITATSHSLALSPVNSVGTHSQNTSLNTTAQSCGIDVVSVEDKVDICERGSKLDYV